MNIKIPYKPRDWATELHDTKKRWIIAVCHRRSGKTTASINHLQRDALQTPNSRFAYISPTYKQSKNVAWDLLKHYAKDIPNVQFNESELRCDYPNGSRITLYGADNPDALRGIGLWGVVLDEYSQQPSNIFTEIIRPALSDHQGYAIWIGTPKGKNAFWKLYKGLDEHDDPVKDFDTKWLAIMLKASDSGILPQEELDDSRVLMSEDEYAQEFECSFEAAIKGAYYAHQLAKAREDGRITSVPYDEMLPVYTWWDLGVGDATSIIFMQSLGKEWRMIDYYEATGEGLGHYIDMLEEKKYRYQGHYAPHDIKVREMTSGRSRLEIAKELGIDFHIVPKLTIEDGINAARMKFSQLWIDEKKCSRFLHCLSLYRKEWDDKRGAFRNRPLHDFTSNAADALRYWGVSNVGGSRGMSVHRPKNLGFGARRTIYK